MEHHSGTHERTEMFGGKRFRKAHSCHTKVMAEKRKLELIRRGNLARIEAEGRGHYNVYARKKR